MSHNLKVETGRWSRTPKELRVCSCTSDTIQTEEHVLLHCPLSDQCRQRYPALNFSSMSELLEGEGNLRDLYM